MTVHPELMLGVVAVVVGLVAAVIERRREREDTAFRERFAVLEATTALRLDAIGERMDVLDVQVADLAESVTAPKSVKGPRG